LPPIQYFAVAFLPAELDHPVVFLVLGSLAAMLVSTSKAGFGGSIGILSLPILIYACGRDSFLAVGTMLPLLIGCDVVAVISWWRRWNLRAVLLLLPGAVGGMLIGFAALWWMRSVSGSSIWEGQETAEAWLNLSIGVIALGFVFLQLYKALVTRPLRFRPVFWQGTIFGGLAGLTSTLAHAGGPIITMYMLPQQMPKDRYVASTVLYYAIGNQMKVIPFLILGMLNAEVLGAAALLLPAVIAGALLGLLLHNKVGQRSFNTVVYSLLALAGVDLIRKSVEVLWL